MVAERAQGNTPGRSPVVASRESVSFGVVIPALNEERHVGALLSDVARQTRRPDEVVDAGSTDGTAAVVERFPGVVLLAGAPPVAKGRNLGGRSIRGEVLIFLNADVRLPGDFFEGFLREFEERRLDVACPAYAPHRSTRPIRAAHAFFNGLFETFEGVLPSGAGQCVAVRGDLFRRSQSFDPDLKFDDVELIRRLSKGRRFGIVALKVYVSDRRCKEHGVPKVFLRHLLMALFFVLGKYRWANRIDYEFGDHAF